ncbi:hypothetical protein LshimejAT787_0112330 [Lyophyllum shimeji]|uniref:Uncharacterized protein n=1 Tax=Lyophyllum shimeji TaxID=47721 RepID=A0A9P3PF65_LYOSH|nr:hypothetical protein LshimejAT787_0112330 [Lyophyllum shimeji]
MSSPSKSRWARMGGVVRRASSVLVATRPSTPSIASSDRDADSTSVKGVSAATAPATLSPPPPAPSQPSPIAESPARERAESQDEDPAPPTVDPSPLAQLPVTASHAETEEPGTQTSPVQEYIPPPLIDSTAVGPGGFTDEPDELPQSQPIRDPSFIQADSTDGHGSVAHPATPPAEPVDPVPQAPQSEYVPTEPVTPEPVTPPPGPAGAYFDIPVRDEPLEDPELSYEEPEQAVEQDVFGTVASPAVVPEPAPELEERTRSVPLSESRDANVHEDVATATAAVIPTPEPLAAPDMPMPQPKMPTPAPQPAVHPSAVSAFPPFDIHLGQEVWGGVMRKPGTNGDASGNSSVRMPFEDPFADPIAPRITVSQHEHLPMPLPQTSQRQQGSPGIAQGSARGVVMPLPPVHEVIPSKSLQNFPSTQSLRESSGGHFETDETRPLLSAPGSPKNASYLQPNASSPNAVNVSALSGSPARRTSTWPMQEPTVAFGTVRLHNLGWLEYQLPDGTTYYVHPTRRVCADLDLRDEDTIEALVAYFERRIDGSGAPAGMELWLSGEEKSKRRRKGNGFEPMRLWVNHKLRTAMVEPAQNGKKSKGKGKTEHGDDQLDLEYRYWSFMEAHPAHTALPPNARVEATDVLTWAWTDRLLPSHRTIPAPFTQEECQELMSLLKSFDQAEGGLQTVVHTRIVCRILLRVAHWRQQHFRPNKPLPSDVGGRDISLPKDRRPLRRALTDFIISCLCLGIPYLFFERSRPCRLDEESGVRGAAGPTFIVGACTCLIAAIVLSASVTFLSLPGLDNFSRVAGFVAALFAAVSMCATLVALFRYKSDLESPVSHVGSEGLTMLSKRSVVYALPTVFLAYAIIGFVTGIVLYSFRGTAPDKAAPSQAPFAEYTRWTVVGVLGALAGILTTSLLLLRR